MMSLLILTGLLLSAGAQSETPDPAQPGLFPLVQTVDDRAASNCMGAMVGFRNVPLRCVVGTDGSLEQCEVLSTNRTVRRYDRVYRCMAAAVTVAYADGTPAVGRSVAFRINGRSILSDPHP